MAITYRGAATDSNPGGAQGLLALPRPTALEPGDFLVAVLCVDGGPAVTLEAPPGWELLQRIDGAASIAVYTHRAAIEPPYWTWTPSAAGAHTGVVAAYGGVDRYVAIDASAGAAGTAPAIDLATLSTGIDGCQLVAAVALATAGAITFPAPWSTRGDSTHTAGGNSTRIGLADRLHGTAGDTPPTAVGAVGASAGFLLALRPSTAVTITSHAEALDFVHGLMPPGFEELYDLDAEDGIGGILEALAESLREFGHDAADHLARELLPTTAVDKLPDWERALGVSADEIAAAATLPARQAQVGGRLRELGGSGTQATVRAVVGLLLGYADPADVSIVRPLRADLHNAHEKVDVSGFAIPGPGSVAITFDVADAGQVSRAGVLLRTFGLVFADPTQLTITVVGPTGPHGQANVTIPAAQLGRRPFTGAPPNNAFWARDAAGASIAGTWTVTFTSSGGAGTFDELYFLVEGVGREANGSQGLLHTLFEWSVLVDPQLAGARGYALYGAAEKAIRRLTRAHTGGGLAYMATPGSGGGDFARADDDNAIADHCVCDT